MEISKAEIEKILKTLPIGYYIKRNINTTLSDEDCSYYDIMNDKIIISYPQLRQTFSHIQTCNDVESYVRCMLYHETSHAFLTPRRLNARNITNIFEDERIETILKHYYKNVDFKNFVKVVNNFNYEPPKTADELFYQIVRFRVGPKKFLDRVTDIINDYYNLNPLSDYVYNYENDIRCLYCDVVNYFSNTYKNNDLTNNYNKLKNQNQNQNQDDNQNMSNNLDNNNSIQIEEDNTDIDNDSLDIQPNEIITNFIDKFNSTKIENDINQILSSYKTATKNNGSAINAYSGQFNPRSVIRDDYKYFVQQNRIGHVKAFSKLHLNLFIDCSSSFIHNDITVNKILKALSKFERQNRNFSFDLISCGVGQRLRKHSDRVQESNGGTGLTSDIFEQFKRLQFTDAQNMNIVLYDGDMFLAFSGYEKRLQYNNIKAFDTSNTTLIVDSSNNYYTKNLSRCKVTIVDDNDYTSKLYDSILLALRQMTKN